jgi:hypothetical protein
MVEHKKTCHHGASIDTQNMSEICFIRTLAGEELEKGNLQRGQPWEIRIAKKSGRP